MSEENGGETNIVQIRVKGNTDLVVKKLVKLKSEY